MDIECLYKPDLHLEAMRLARQFNRLNPYDARYLALVQVLDCAVWTADERIYNTVRIRFPFICWVEERPNQEKQGSGGMQKKTKWGLELTIKKLYSNLIGSF
jgi:hypothetical protein